MLLISATGLNEDKTPGTFRLFFTQRFALSMLDREHVRSPVHVLERRKDLAHIPFDDVVEGNNLVKARDCQDNGIRRCWHYRCQNRDAGHDSESAFGTDEQLLQIVS